MNIETRLKKLETTNPDSTYCSCLRAFEIELIRPDLNKTEDQKRREREERRKPQFCDDCSKEIKAIHIEVN